MSNKVYGYIRVSTQEQNIERQMIALLGAGMERKDIYIDKQSGKNFKRPAYARMMRRVREGDLIIVKSIDRLGRNYQEIMEQWRIITKEKKVDIRIMDMPLLDTTRTKDLLGTFISDVVLQLLSLLRRMSAIISASGRQKELRRRRHEGYVLASRKSICRIISRNYIGSGRGILFQSKILRHYVTSGGVPYINGFVNTGSFFHRYFYANGIAFVSLKS